MASSLTDHTGKLQTGITLGISSNGLVQMRSLQQTVRGLASLAT
jgi:hypothetical protein